MYRYSNRLRLNPNFRQWQSQPLNYPVFSTEFPTKWSIPPALYCWDKNGFDLDEMPEEQKAKNELMMHAI